MLSWVKSGGVLYLSGDLSYDEFRRRTRTARLEELCGVRFVAECYPNIAVNPASAADQPCLQVEAAGARVLQRTANGWPLLVEHRVGRGRVLFITDPIELHSPPARRANDQALYRRVLETAGVASLAVAPDDPRLHVMRVPLRDGGKVWILFNTDETQPKRDFTLTHDQRPITVTVARHRPALLWFDGAGALRSVEAQGACAVGSERIALDETRGILLSLDGLDVRRSRALLLMPTQPGQVQWRSTTAWTAPVVETGEFQNGRWRILESQAARSGESQLQIGVSADQAFSLLLVCERTAVVRWRQALERAITQPASLP